MVETPRWMWEQIAEQMKRLQVLEAREAMRSLESDTSIELNPASRPLDFIDRVVLEAVRLGGSNPTAMFRTVARTTMVEVSQTSDSPSMAPSTSLHIPLLQGSSLMLDRYAGNRSPSVFPRPTDFAGLAAGPRLSRSQSQGLRRPRQLQPGLGRAVGLPRDQRGQGQARPGDEHRHRHHGQDRRRGADAAAGIRHALP